MFISVYILCFMSCFPRSSTKWSSCVRLNTCWRSYNIIILCQLRSAVRFEEIICFINLHRSLLTSRNRNIIGASRGIWDLGRRAIYFQGAGEH